MRPREDQRLSACRCQAAHRPTLPQTHPNLPRCAGAGFPNIPSPNGDNGPRVLRVRQEGEQAPPPPTPSLCTQDGMHWCHGAMHPLSPRIARRRADGWRRCFAGYLCRCWLPSPRRATPCSSTPIKPTGELERRSLHTACPVIKGVKWSAPKVGSRGSGREADGGCHCCSMPWCLLPWATVDTPRRFSGPISISTVGPRRPLRRGRREATAHPANPTGGAGRLECTIWRQQLVLCCNAGVRWQPMFRSPLYLACPAPSAHGPHHPAG